MLRIFSTGPVGPVVQIFTCPANIFTGPATKNKIVAVIIVFDLLSCILINKLMTPIF